MRKKWTEKRRKQRSKQYSGKGNPYYGKKHSKEVRERISEKRRGVWNGVGFSKGHIPWNKGVKGIHLSPETEFKKGNLPKINYRKGENHPHWKGGISHKYRESYLAKLAGRPRPDRCDVCGREGKIYFDHDHKTEEFRGWLCHKCNFALGHVDDSVEILRGLIKYLQEYEKRKM